MDLSNGTSPAPEQNLTRVDEGYWDIWEYPDIDLSIGMDLSNGTSPAPEQNREYRRIMFMVLLSVVCVLGVLGNGVVIWATGFRMKKTVSTVWYLNLAVADFLFTAFLPLKITTIASIDFHWPFGWFMCKMDVLVFYVNMYASVFTLTVISVDRCVCVVCPLWARCSGHRTVRKASWVSLGVWVMALAPSIPNAIVSYTEPSTSGEGVWCYNGYNNTTIGFTTNFVMGFVVPFSVIISCYSVIIYRLRNNRSLASQSGRSFRIIAAVIAVFSLCWIPFHIIELIYVCYDNGLIEASGTLDLVLVFAPPITFALAFVNSCVNPLLYVFSQGFKGVFRRNVLKVLEKAFAETPASLASDQQHSHSPGRQPSNDCPSV